MVERASAGAGDEQKEGCADDRDQIERQDEDKFADLAEGERGVDGGACGLAELLHRVGGIVEEDAGGRDHVDPRAG